MLTTLPIPVTDAHLALLRSLRRPPLIRKALTLIGTFELRNGARPVGLRLQAQEEAGPRWRVDLLEGDEPAWIGMPLPERAQ